jgi:hypothetical protein
VLASGLSGGYGWRVEPWWSASSAGPTAEPGTHALVIGVSRYERLPPYVPANLPWVVGMGQLESAATTAAQFARWLLETHHLPDAPLQSIWLLLSFSDAEESALTREERSAPRARLEHVAAAVTAWKGVCRRHADNVAVIYAAGHGIGQGRYEPGVLLLEDYAAGGMEGLLEHTLSITTLHGVMAGSNSGIPRRQFGFFDACRTRHPETLKRDLNGAWPPWSAPLERTAETCPMYLGTADGARAYGRPGGVTLFWEALHACLTEDAVSTLDGRDAIWGIRDDRILHPLRARLSKFAEDAEVNQVADVVPAPSGVPFHICHSPPLLERSFGVSPDVAGEWAHGTLRHDENDAEPEFADVPLDEPHTTNVPAGNYEFSVTIDSDQPMYASARVLRFIRPSGETRIDVPVAQGQEAVPT